MKWNEQTQRHLRAALAGHASARFHTTSEAETRQLAARLAQSIVPRPEKRGENRIPEFTASLAGGEVIALVGELGSGKTTFVKGFCSALGVTGRVTSPTFTLMHVYEGGVCPIYHFDFYRLESVTEVAALGCEEYFDSEAISLIEWPELAWQLIPARALQVHLVMPDFTSRPEARDIEIKRVTVGAARAEENTTYQRS